MIFSLPFVTGSLVLISAGLLQTFVEVGVDERVLRLGLNFVKKI